MNNNFNIIDIILMILFIMILFWFCSIRVLNTILVVLVCSAIFVFELKFLILNQLFF